MKIKKIIIGVLLVLCVCMVPGYRQTTELAAKLTSPMTIAIDPGHGGADSGASAADGTSEKDINLAIAKALAKEAQRYGVTTVLTRTDDQGLYSKENTSGKWSKLGDLKERKRIIDEASADLVITIHLNSFKQDSKVRGAQVFFPKAAPEEFYEENKKLAEAIQESLNKGIDDGAERIVLPKGDIYLFKEPKQPMILVECGFLSNAMDAENLKTDKFQQKIAGCIMKAVAENYNLKLSKRPANKIVQSRTN